MRSHICVNKCRDGLGGYFVCVFDGDDFKSIGLRDSEPRFETRYKAKKAGEEALAGMASEKKLRKLLAKKSRTLKVKGR